MIGVETRYYMNVRVDNLLLDTALEQVESLIEQSKEDGVPRQVFFTNVHSIHLARKDTEFRRYLDKADLVLPDGSGLKIAGKVLEMPILENLNGTDFTPKVCRMAETGKWSVYLLGAREDVVKRCSEKLKERFPNLSLIGYHNGYFSKNEEDEIVEEINKKKPDILLVALGQPYQEKWIARNANRLNTHICLAVGGLFDFLAGAMKRAPLWMRKLGIEWFHRFLQDPKSKWDRILIEIPVFLSLVLQEKVISLTSKRNLNQLRWIFNGQRDRYIRS
ncbi:MAG: WecB/TagA/CpsF family glycosyltransferase [Gracilimonas sp.]|uniref:WecB/TagA/CpsF family glycosyltransferase n=1 Tax=Gracilimonas sp. TaxID=1974203 RepID=UPI0019ADD6DD|nr:WecB/TagA/CpsF family glycosyltransferase [Gracilimonas sp.]MBD3615429.1 WecB/TagA/CpsF family glycosyltransferase [Gracilimonas sp.]